VDAGARKPAARFFEYALGLMQLRAADVLFVGNQRNTDIAGGNALGVPTVYLADAAYRSADDGPCIAEPTFTIATLAELPALVTRLNGPAGHLYARDAVS
jgi:FMN phosphatase YigB (HAD superfamily)